jgi:hypothetical protein
LTKTSHHEEKFENYVSQVEAARIRGVSKQAIADLVKRARLSTIKIAGRTLILRSEVEKFVPQPKLGRPPKKKQANKGVRKDSNLGKP